MRHAVALTCLLVGALLASAPSATAATISLDGVWKLATDPTNAGRGAGWFKGGPPAPSKDVAVPGIIQIPFPGYHGVAWYWREFTAPANLFADGRYLLKFWAVDYLADVWVNGIHVGSHEGGETPFIVDITGSIKPDGPNLIAVRVLNPTDQPIDGIVLGQTPHRNKVMGYSPGNSWNHGGIVDSVELLTTPAVRVSDVFVRTNSETGVVYVRAAVFNALEAPRAGNLTFTIAPATTGATLVSGAVAQDFPPGESVVQAVLTVPSFQLWQLNDPRLYRMTAGVRINGDKGPPQSSAMDESSTRFGFRDFRFQDGYFQLNGKRLFLRSSHTGNHVPVGEQIPLDPGLLRRDLILLKTMGFNTIRFGMGLPTRYQLDLCDEIGLMAYEESYASWVLGDSPKMGERFDRSTRDMILRDRNHPSIVAWGLLNETTDGPVARHALAALPVVRSVDNSRLVIFSSGRWDHLLPGGSNMVLDVWSTGGAPDPNVTHNPLDRVYTIGNAVWPGHQVAFHPGEHNDFSDVRFTAPRDADYVVDATFTGIAKPPATTDVHVLRRDRSLFDDKINLAGRPNAACFGGSVKLAKGETLDFVVGSGNGNFGSDSTSLTLQIHAPGDAAAPGEKNAWDVSEDFSATQNPAGPWSFGTMPPAPAPSAATFALYAVSNKVKKSGALDPGSVSNPYTANWQDVLGDLHTYPRFPHNADVIHDLRTADGLQGSSTQTPLLISEYGVGSAVDLVRVVNLYEQAGHGQAEDAQFYRAQRDRFLADWDRWSMRDAFGTPENYFNDCISAMGQRRLIGLNALRSNPNLVGHSMSGSIDQGMSGEGLATTFRELKPGTVDAISDGLAPLRWCLFADPPVIYRGGKVRVEAVLADEDVLLPGDYTAHIRVLGPDNHVVLERAAKISIASRLKSSTTRPSTEPAIKPGWVHQVLNEELVVDGPPGRYRLEAGFDHGAAAGERTEFYVDDAAAMPPVTARVTLWGDDPDLTKWLDAHHIRAERFDPAHVEDRRDVVLVSRLRPPGEEGAVFSDLARRIARGSTAIFLAHDAFARSTGPLGWLPLANKGAVVAMPGWLYVKDDWAKALPAFSGLPIRGTSGGLLDPVYYRDLIADTGFSGQDPPAEAISGANNTALGYSSGLTLAAYRLGEGRFVINTLHILENLGHHPAAERLLRNLLNEAAKDVDKPQANLPDHFNDQLKAMGYPIRTP